MVLYSTFIPFSIIRCYSSICAFYCGEKWDKLGIIWGKNGGVSYKLGGIKVKQGSISDKLVGIILDTICAAFAWHPT